MAPLTKQTWKAQGFFTAVRGCVCLCVFVQDDADAHHTDISVIEQDMRAVQLILHGLIGLSK